MDSKMKDKLSKFYKEILDTKAIAISAKEDTEKKANGFGNSETGKSLSKEFHASAAGNQLGINIAEHLEEKFAELFPGIAKEIKKGDWEPM